jgi:hypothetical protein
MSKDLDAIAYRNSLEKRLRRLEETVLLLSAAAQKTFYTRETQNIYERHLSDIRGDVDASENNKTVTND